MPACADPLHFAVLYYAICCYEMFDELGDAAAREAADFCQAWSLEQPLWMRNKKGQFDKRVVPHLGAQSSVCAMAVIAAYLVWRQKQVGNPIPDESLLQAADAGYTLYALQRKANKDEPTAT